MDEKRRKKRKNIAGSGIHETERTVVSMQAMGDAWRAHAALTRPRAEALLDRMSKRQPVVFGYMWGLYFDVSSETFSVAADCTVALYLAFTGNESRSIAEISKVAFDEYLLAIAHLCDDFDAESARPEVAISAVDSFCEPWALAFVTGRLAEADCLKGGKDAFASRFLFATIRAFHTAVNT
jgi:hypothetical protein